MSVTPEQVAVELGRPTPVDPQVAAQWSSWIGQAEYLIGKRLGDITALDPNDVDYVVLQSVVEHARNPQNATQVDVTIDDGRVSRRYTSAAGRVVIPDELWGLLDPDMLNASGVGSTRLYGEPDAPAVDVWTS